MKSVIFYANLKINSKTMLNIFTYVSLMRPIELLLIILGLFAVVKVMKKASKIKKVPFSFMVILRYLILAMILAFVLFTLYNSFIPPPTAPEILITKTKVISRALVKLDKIQPLQNRLLVRFFFPHFDMLQLVK